MTSSMQPSQTYGDMGRSESGCRVVVAVFGHDKMCIPSPASVRVVGGEHLLRGDASLVGRIHGLLQSRGLEVLHVEQSSQPDCLALLIHARTSACSTANLVALRKDLESAGRDLGVTIRVQREELFVYMHRI